MPQERNFCEQIIIVLKPLHSDWITMDNHLRLWSHFSLQLELFLLTIAINLISCPLAFLFLLDIAIIGYDYLFLLLDYQT